MYLDWSINITPSAQHLVLYTNGIYLPSTVVKLTLRYIPFSHEVSRACVRLYLMVQNMTAIIENNSIVISNEKCDFEIMRGKTRIA